LLVYGYDAANGRLTQLQQLSTLPPEFVGTNFTSEVRVAQDGNFVYAANRLHDTISFFAVGASGQLARVGEASTLGRLSSKFHDRSKWQLSRFVQPAERRPHGVSHSRSAWTGRGT
jgi:6-phosphogluconolactonase (cycloisomerase 2 family)